MIPDDDPSRPLTVAHPDDPGTTYVSLVGNTYAMLVTGEQTGGRYCLIGMYVPDGGGPPPHRHDFEEMFTVLEGEIEFTFRGEKHVAVGGAPIKLPAHPPPHDPHPPGGAGRVVWDLTPAGE
ncbi:cupin domain-containing protein, partial [Streptomyces griseoaurantiacus]|uniref:cupin domain-containing protein n=1 Tax=Streptomyces griseoaurantiacus TaxID=68213 RepID=UPI0037AF9AC8